MRDEITAVQLGVTGMGPDGTLKACIRVMKLTVLFFALSSAGLAQKGPQSMTVMEARRELKLSLASEVERVSATLTPNGIRINGRVMVSSNDLSEPMKRKRKKASDGEQHNVRFENNATLPLSDISEVSNAHCTCISYEEVDHYYVSVITLGRTDYTFYWLSQDDARRFSEAIQWLVSHASEVKSSLAAADNFADRVAQWRSAALKPAMPDAAHVHEVLAKNAVEEKNFNKAIDEYEAGLEIFPTWPEGQFNLALICGETGDYDCAVEHMQDYLELVPNAPDVQAAKDKLIIWNDKLGKSQ